MSSNPQGNATSGVTPSMEVARSVHGSTLGASTRKDLELALEDWTQLRPSEQRFTLAHLLYLFLEGQEAQRVLLESIAHRLEEGLDLQEELIETIADDEDEEGDDGEADLPLSQAWEARGKREEASGSDLFEDKGEMGREGAVHNAEQGEEVSHE